MRALVKIKTIYLEDLNVLEMYEAWNLFVLNRNMGTDIYCSIMNSICWSKTNNTAFWRKLFSIVAESSNHSSNHLIIKL